MTRFSEGPEMRSALMLLMLAASSPSWAGQFVSDAFGLVPAAGSPDDRRSRWSGWVGDDRTGSLRQPGEPDTVLFVLGPKSLVAGKDRGHAAAIVLDDAGNLVDDETTVTLTIDGKPVYAATRAGIADHLFLPAPRAGEILAGATVGGQQSSREMVRVVPDTGSLVPLLGTLPESVLAEAFFEIPTGRMTDRFGNLADDGVAVSILLDHGAVGHSLATATVIDGDAAVRFLSRDIGGQTRVVAWLGANASQPGTLGVELAEPLATPELIGEELPSIGSVRLTVGPFLTAYGYTLTDGANVTLHARSRSGRLEEAAGWVRDGHFVCLLPIPSLGDIEMVEVTTAMGRMELGPVKSGASGLEAME